MIQYLSNQNLNNFSGKVCLLRIDLNIEPKLPLDSYRFQAIIPTVQLLLKHNIKLIILSHRGRPVNKEKKLSLNCFIPLFKKYFDTDVVFVSNFQKNLKSKIQNSNKIIFLFENLRFYQGEEKNDINFAKNLSLLGDFYINDAFAVSHRENSSVVAITKFLPSYAGLLLEKEIKNLNKIIKNYKHPFVIIIGGAKISDKIGVIQNFIKKADYFLLGGGPANTFFAAQGIPIGNSLVDNSILGSFIRGSTSKILKLISKEVNSRKIILPSDVKISDRKILDIGERTTQSYNAIIKKSKTIIWNGPMGMFEKKEFENGTFGIWQAIIKNKKANIVIGGGETVASLQKFRIQNPKLKINKNIFISTGGGAMLDYLSGKKLPGIEALKRS
ncbi:MAG: phosphoglycerate kinase [Minisyncoccia bacterium]